MFSPQENAVFTVVNGFGESFDVITLSYCHPCAQPLPSLSGRGWEGLGVGLATSHLAATTRMHLKHRDFGRLVAEWQQFLQKIGSASI